MSKPPPGPWMLGQVMGIYSEVHWCSGWQHVTVLDFQHGKNVGIPLVLPTMIVHELVNFPLVAKFHSEHPSSHPQTSPDYVLSSWLRNSIFYIFIGEV